MDTTLYLIKNVLQSSLNNNRVPNTETAFFRLQPRQFGSLLAKIECVATHRLLRSYFLEYLVIKKLNPCLLILLLRDSQQFSC